MSIEQRGMSPSTTMPLGDPTSSPNTSNLRCTQRGGSAGKAPIARSTWDESERTPVSWSRLQHLPIRRLAEPHQQRLAFADRRSAEVAGWAEDMGGKGRVIGRVTLHVERDGPLATAG